MENFKSLPRYCPVIWSLMSFIAFLYFSNQLTLLGPAYLSVSKDQDRVKEVALVFEFSKEGIFSTPIIFSSVVK